MHGSAFALARWFQPERYANRPEDDFVREEILGDLYAATTVAVHTDGTTLVRTPNGAAMVEAYDDRGAPLVRFDYVRHDRWERTAFDMNASSVRHLGDHLRTLPRVPFDELFVGATA